MNAHYDIKLSTRNREDQSWRSAQVVQRSVLPWHNMAVNLWKSSLPWENTLTTLTSQPGAKEMYLKAHIWSKRNNLLWHNQHWNIPEKQSNSLYWIRQKSSYYSSLRLPSREKGNYTKNKIIKINIVIIVTVVMGVIVINMTNSIAIIIVIATIWFELIQS